MLPSTSEESMSVAERALSPAGSHSTGGCGTGGEYSIPFHLYTSIIPLPAPTAGSKRKADALDGTNDDDHPAKQQKRRGPVAMADGNVPLQKTWEMTELVAHKGLLSKFRVSPPSCCLMSIRTLMSILALKENHSPCYG